MFRPATIDDVLFIEKLIRKFYQETGGIYGIPYDVESSVLTIIRCVMDGVCLVGGKSAAGAILGKFPFNKDAVIAWVLFWRFSGTQQIKIFEALLDACKERGATHVNAASHFPDNRILRYYSKLGLQPVETQAIKQL